MGRDDMGMMQKNADRGFTLIEVLIALVLLAVGIAGMVPTLLHTIKGNAFAGDTTQAATYAQAKLEELRRKAFDDASSTDDLVGMCGSLQTDTTADGFEIKWQVKDAAGTASCTVDVLVIETCAAEASVVDALCFPATGTPQIARHFLAARANFDL